jgi:hypothetical protein
LPITDPLFCPARVRWPSASKIPGVCLVGKIIVRFSH